MARSNSVRFILTLWYIGILALTLCLFSGTLYLNIASNLDRGLNESLTLQADAAAGTLNAFWKAEGSSQGNWQTAPSATLQGEIERGGLKGLIKRWADKTGYLEEGYPIRLLDRYGQPLLASPAFEPLDPALSKEVTERVREGFIHTQTLSTPAGRYRVVTRPIIENERVLFLVQAAASLRPMESSLGRLRLLLLWLIPLTLAITSLVGWFLASTALKPVGRMVAQAKQISATELDRRIDVPKTGDELEALAAALNEILEKLERAFRQLRQFSAAASHELRTPLTIMKGELEVALRRPRDSEEYQRVLKTNLETINDISQTVEELLALARAEAVDSVVEWQLVELGALIAHLTDTYRNFADSKEVRLELSAPGTVWVRGEKRLLERMVANLLENAIRHTPSGGKVSMRTDMWKGKACVIVQDTGPGISSEDMPQLFDRFFRAREVSQNGNHSTGLGLGLCRWIADVHHGHLEVSSPPGQGATFTVWLPQIFAPR